jgi:hypothetical protein
MMIERLKIHARIVLKACAVQFPRRRTCVLPEGCLVQPKPPQAIALRPNASQSMHPETLALTGV